MSTQNVTKENFFSFFMEAMDKLGNEHSEKLCDYFKNRAKSRLDYEIKVHSPNGAVYMLENKTKREDGYY